MLSARLLALAAALFQTTRAFEGSSPLLAWSSYDRPELFGSQRSDVHKTTLRGLLHNHELCDSEAVVIISHPGLHANDLKSLPSTSFLSGVASNAKRSLRIPHMPSHSPGDLRHAAEALSRLCIAPYVELDLSSEASPVELKEKGVYYLSASTLYGDGGYRRQRVEDIEYELARTVSQIEKSFSKHIIIYTGSSLPESDLYKRQTYDSDTQPFSFANGTHKFAVGNDGIFHRYALFSPGLIVALAVVLFLLVPILLAAVRSLASIQSSVRLDAPKGPSMDKKNQ